MKPNAFLLSILSLTFVAAPASAGGDKDFHYKEFREVYLYTCHDTRLETLRKKQSSATLKIDDEPYILHRETTSFTQSKDGIVIDEAGRALIYLPKSQEPVFLGMTEATDKPCVTRVNLNETWRALLGKKYGGTKLNTDGSNWRELDVHIEKRKPYSMRFLLEKDGAPVLDAVYSTWISPRDRDKRYEKSEALPASQKPHVAAPAASVGGSGSI